MENVVVALDADPMVKVSPDTFVQAKVGPAPVPPDEVTVAASVVRFAEAMQVAIVPEH